MDAASKLAFERSAPAKNQHRQQKQRDGTGFQKGKNALP